jgi:hypothetical protein
LHALEDLERPFRKGGRVSRRKKKEKTKDQRKDKVRLSTKDGGSLATKQDSLVPKEAGSLVTRHGSLMRTEPIHQHRVRLETPAPAAADLRDIELDVLTD